jgi:beta-phosphoglucomutase family hydrolase
MSENRLEAVIWDMDGVIADTAEYHYRAWHDTLAGYGADLTREHFLRFFGQLPEVLVKDVAGSNVSPEVINKIVNDKEADFRLRFGNNVKALPGATGLIKSLSGHGIKQAVASSAPLENIDVVLRGIGIEGCFQAIVFGDEVSEGKPSPQIFLLAAKKLGVSAGNCVVFEDAVAGVAGAKSAGMKCVAVTNSHPREKLKQADLVIASLEEIDVDSLTSLFSC